jgi:uncharacterized membrane protein
LLRQLIELENGNMPLASFWAERILFVQQSVIRQSLAEELFWLFVMYQAYSQREYRIPIIGAIAAKQVG